jgi:6-phosphogluconolactonase
MHLYVGGMPSESIGAWRLDPGSLKAAKTHDVDGLFSPSFLCLHPKLPVLYAAERSWSSGDTRAGAVTAFAIAPRTGELRRLDRWPSGGAFTAHVNVSADGQYLMTANPRGPTVALFRLNARGLPEQPPCVVYHSGRGATLRQEAPWPHSCYFDWSGQRALVCDLGLDRVFVYDLDRHSTRLTPARQPFAQVSSGAGARHLALGVDNHCIYVANELDSTVSVFKCDTERGYLSIVQTLNSVPEQHLSSNQPAEIAVAPDGRHLYLTNRGHDTVAVFEIARSTGRLSCKEMVSCEGSSPRHLCIDRRGTLMAVCNQRSQEVVLFRMSRDGRLQPSGERLSVPNPTCALVAGYA